MKGALVNIVKIGLSILELFDTHDEEELAKAIKTVGLFNDT